MSAFLIVTGISVVTTLAALGLSRVGRGGTGTSVLAPGLAAGVMLWLAFVEVAPDSTATMGLLTTVVAMAGGAALVWLASRLAHRTTVAAGIAPVIGVALVLHDVPEGFAVGAVLGSAGLLASLPVVVAVAAHNLPEKLAFVAPAAAERAPLGLVLVAATIPEPIGAALAGIGAAAAPGAVALAVAVAGGMMIAVAVGALPTVARRASALRPFLGAGVAGAMSMAALGIVLPS